MPETIELLSAFDPFDGEAAGTRRSYVLLDVFADAPLQGNQLAVLTDARGMETETMQSVARELKLSETVFVLPPEGDGDVGVRIFTPTAELPFAGHPVLGSAVVVSLALGRPEVVLETFWPRVLLPRLG
jgi:trans-2,3-dihydro-3-hydroxyanthranilate isomerase